MNERFFNALHVGRIDLWVADLKRSADFYENALGLTAKKHTADSIEYTANGNDVLLAIHKTDEALSENTYGLYHVAFLVPNRKALGRFLRHLIAGQIAIGGAADHYYSEAIYLRDPDGNGIEVARDKYDIEWTDEFGRLKTTTDEFDYPGVFYAAGSGNASYNIHKETTIGHLHLHGKHTDKQHMLYEQILGFERHFDETINAMFFSKSMYHHHIAINDWLNKRSPAKNKQNGLRSFTLRTNQLDEIEMILDKLNNHNIPFEELNGFYMIEDADENTVRLELCPDETPLT